MNIIGTGLLHQHLAAVDDVDSLHCAAYTLAREVEDALHSRSGLLLHVVDACGRGVFCILGIGLLLADVLHVTQADECSLGHVRTQVEAQDILKVTE